MSVAGVGRGLVDMTSATGASFRFQAEKYFWSPTSSSTIILSCFEPSAASFGAVAPLAKKGRSLMRLWTPRRTIATAGLVVFLTSAPLLSAQNVIDGGTDQGRYYLVRSASSSLCLDVPGWSWKIGEAVVQNGCSGQATQSWFFRQVDPDAYQLTVKHDALCLRVAGGATADGTPVTQEPCARAGAAFNGTRFVVSRVGTSTPATYQLRTSAPGMCLRSPSN